MRRSSTQEFTMRYRPNPVKYSGGDEDDGGDANPSGGCGDGDGCGRS